MSKTTLVPVTVMKLTVTRKGHKSSKRVTTADQAAEFFASEKTYDWWSSRGRSLSEAGRNVQYHQFYIKLRRRTLPIFKKYLP